MSFRKRNSGNSSPSVSPSFPAIVSPSTTTRLSSPGIRPSPLDGRPVTSTGTQTIDDLLAGHAGLALGSSLMFEENGTTDFAGTLLRYFAAEGVVQGHHVHVVGVGAQWGRELPGVVDTEQNTESMSGPKASVDDPKMKIAWRYERLGDFGAGAVGSRVPRNSSHVQEAPTIVEREPAVPTKFCHTFDLTKRLTMLTPITINFLPISMTTSADTSPYISILAAITQAVSSSSPSTIHRFLIPSLLSPVMYPPHASEPIYLLPFLHSLRALLRRHAHRLTIMITVPLSLFPRNTGLTCWIEHLVDGVLEIAPFHHSIDVEPTLNNNAGAKKGEEKHQGMVKIHKLPVLTEKGGGSGGGDDLAFSFGRKRLVVQPYSLPPVEGDEAAQKGETEGKVKAQNIIF